MCRSTTKSSVCAEYVMARRICRTRDEGNKHFQAGTGMPELIDSEEL
jgi:hypothetical protein